jgi:DNA polymerase I
MIIPQTREAYQLLHDGVLAFARAEQMGMRVDVEYYARKKKHLTRKISREEEKIKATKFYKQWQHVFKGKTNIFSNQQLATLLYKVRGIVPPKMAEKGMQGATDEETLSQLGIPEVVQLVKIRKWKKIRDTYLDGFMREQIDGTLHPFFNLHMVRTYRSSSDRPNFQNVPKRDKEAKKLCRHGIYPRFGHQIASLDFSGIEVRMACIYTEDEKLTYDTLHGDMHKDMAVELYMLDSLDKHDPGEGNLRQGGKNGFVFPEFYGDYYGNCANGLLKWASVANLKDGTPALEHLEKKKLIKLKKDGTVKNSDRFVEHVRDVEDQFWNVRYKTYNKWKERTWKEYQKKGFIEMKTGFRCGGVMSRKDVGNYPFQGSAFHCLLWAFTRVNKVSLEEEWDSCPVGQIHDELTIDSHPDEIEHVMKTAHRITTQDLPAEWDWINVPLEVEAELAGVDCPWDEQEFYKLEE